MRDTLGGMNPRALRLLRGMFVTATTTVIASTAHIAAGGGAPGSVGIVIALLAGSTLGLALLGGPRLHPLRTGLVIALGQVVFHAVFSWGSGGAPVAAGSHSSHSAEGFADVSTLVVHDHAGMVLAHVVAGVLSLGLLLGEQRLVENLVALTARVLRRLRPVTSSDIHEARVDTPLDRDAARPHGGAGVPPPRRRGPPALLASR